MHTHQQQQQRSRPDGVGAKQRLQQQQQQPQRSGKRPAPPAAAADEGDEVMSPRPGGQTSGTEGIRGGQHVDEQDSERDHYYGGSTHSPNVVSLGIPSMGLRV